MWMITVLSHWLLFDDCMAYIKLFINWFISWSCWAWFYSIDLSTPVILSPCSCNFCMPSQKIVSSSSCSFLGTFPVLVRFLSSRWFFLSLLRLRPNAARDSWNCWSSTLPSSWALLADPPFPFATGELEEDHVDNDELGPDFSTWLKVTMSRHPRTELISL